MEFYRNKSRKDGFSVWCKKCNITYNHSIEGKKMKQKRDKKAYKERYQIICELKKHGCVLCSYNKCMRALEFHHINSEDKSFGLTSDALRYFTNKEIIKEFYKCTLLCSNCHRELHTKENDNNDL
jgi:hypothetical protein